MVEKSSPIPEHHHQAGGAPSFPINLPLQGDVNPLGRLMEQYQRLAATETKSVQERLETVKQDKAAAENQYSQYQAYWSGHNWWEAAQQTAANWQALGYSMDNYAPYINNQLNLLQAATNPTVSSNSLTSRLTRISPSSGGMSTSPGGGATTGGGKYSRGNCECPNCMEAERVGISNMPAKKRGVHNCHIRGCGKVYSKSSHLKAHLRWHDGDRNVKPRGPGAA